MKKTYMLPVIAVTLAMMLCIISCDESGGGPNGFHGFTVQSIRNEPVSLNTYRGMVVLVVNTVSKCGFTPQFEGLQELYTRYRDRGFVILGFPSDSFKQELDTDNEIQQFCSLNYGVEFPMFSQISVTGEDIHPLYAFLTSPETNPESSGDITWNFNKFLIDPDGRILARFDSKVAPLDPEIVTAVEHALNH